MNVQFSKQQRPWTGLQYMETMEYNQTREVYKTCRVDNVYVYSVQMYMYSCTCTMYTVSFQYDG